MKRFHAWKYYNPALTIEIYQDEGPFDEVTSNPTHKLLCESDDKEEFLRLLEPFFIEAEKENV